MLIALITAFLTTSIFASITYSSSKSPALRKAKLISDRSLCEGQKPAGVLLPDIEGQNVFIPLPCSHTERERQALMEDMKSHHSEIIKIEVSQDKLTFDDHGEVAVGHLIIMKHVIAP